MERKEIKGTTRIGTRKGRSEEDEKGRRGRLIRKERKGKRLEMTGDDKNEMEREK